MPDNSMMKKQAGKQRELFISVQVNTNHIFSSKSAAQSKRMLKILHVFARRSA